MFLIKVVNALKDNKVNYAITGGYAVALHGAVRATVDIDIVVNISKGSFKKAEKALNSIRLQSKLPVNSEDVFNFRKEYIENRNMIAWSFVNDVNPTELVDIIITQDLKKIKTKRVKIIDSIINIVSIDDLIKIKEKSNRPQDIEDIKSLRKLKK